MPSSARCWWFEALDVLKWYLKYPRYQDMNADSDGVYLNLIGMHEVA